ncbi:MAG: OsmC family protein [Flavobacteriales bacterium]|jgi:uncharacterized OsmC-like protein|nr:OsmC family protein [Flavobacteriales bacterium]
MNYQVNASSTAKDAASFTIKGGNTEFGITPEDAETLPNPAELFLGSLSACMLKNVERFSQMMHFKYSKATITIEAKRTEKPPQLENIKYRLTIYNDDAKLNLPLLKKNLERFGTIYNTIKLATSITGEINQELYV